MRAKNMQKLTDQILSKRPGTTIYGIGDAKHKLEISGHNEDDTPGVRAEDQDADNIPEHRAIDVMIGANFTPADAQQLYDDLTGFSENHSRLLYVIYNKKIRSASRNWEERDYEGDDPHTNHVHVSGEADADENVSDWKLSDWGSVSHVPPQNNNSSNDDLVVDGVLGPKTIAKWQKVMGSHAVDGKISENSLLVEKVQDLLRKTVDRNLKVDGDGNSLDTNVYRKTIAALQKYLGTPVDGVITTPKSKVIEALQRRLNQDRF